MSSCWETLNRALDKASRFQPLALAAIGCSQCRLVIWWAFMLARNSDWEISTPFSMHQAIDAGELAAYIIFIAISTKSAVLHVRGNLPLYPSVIGLMSIIGLSVSSLSYSAIQVFAPPFFCGLGLSSIMLFLLWCEFLSTLIPCEALIAFIISELIRDIVWFTFSEISITFGNIFCGASMVVSTLILVMAYRSKPDTSTLLRLPSRSALPARPLLWCAAFAFAYGLGDSSTGIALTSLAHTLGMMALLIAVIASLVCLRESFSLDYLRQATFVFMTIGLLLALTIPSSSRLAQGLMSAANEALLLFSVTSSCLFARARSTSAVFYCGLLRMCTLLCANAGSYCGSLAITRGVQSSPLLVVALALIVLATSVAFRSTDAFAQDIASFTSTNTSTDTTERTATTLPSIERLANRYHLTGKEKEVLVMLDEGKTPAVISETLFIAPSTVRVHITNIYKKLGVHSHADFSDFIKQHR